MQELKTCPFCGGEAKTIFDYNQVGGDSFIVSAYVKCSQCGVVRYTTKDIKNAAFEDVIALFEKAISLWNTRIGE